jgi:hypothetical protein
MLGEVTPVRYTIDDDSITRSRPRQLMTDVRYEPGPTSTCCLGLLEPTDLNFLILFAGLAANVVLWTWDVTQFIRLW